MIASLTMHALAQNATACSSDGKEGFLPPNNLYIPDRRVVLDRHGNPIGGGITEPEFEGVIAAVEKLYTPIVSSMGGKLVIHRRWKDGTVNAYADRQDGNWNVTMFGGLARHKETTIDGFLLVVCHELGHQIGGAPKYNNGSGGLGEGETGLFNYLLLPGFTIRNVGLNYSHVVRHHYLHCSALIVGVTISKFST
jgi:hypothetical protein